MIMYRIFSFLKERSVSFFILLACLLMAGCGQPASHEEPTTFDTNDPISIEPTVPTEIPNDGLQSYIAELADHRLMDFSRYNSGSSGEGMRREEWVDLCSNGSFFSFVSSTISVGDHISQDSKEEEGTWQVYRKDGSVVIKFRSNEGFEREALVTVEDGKLYLNGKRFYHIPKGDANGPQSCN